MDFIIAVQESDVRNRVVLGLPDFCLCVRGVCMLWIDMDGVLNRYERWVYRGSSPLFLQSNAHYYRTAPVDKKGVELLNISTRFGTDYRILSSLPNGVIRMEHYNDKLYWLIKNFPDAANKFLICSGSKVDYVKDMMGIDSLSESDILIDDFNPNLVEWNRAGGTAIKFINGVNTASSWEGFKIKGIDDLVEILKSLRRE